MKKIPTIFERDWEGDRSRVIDKPNPAAAWVFAGEGIATRKLDGTSCLIKDGKFFKRREIKKGQTAPAEFVLADFDEETGKTVGWMPVTDSAEDQHHRKGYWSAEQWFGVGNIPDGTYELVGPGVQGNPERFDITVLQKHSNVIQYEDTPRTFDALREWLATEDIEGLVWHHRDGRMAKIKLRDFGLKRPAPPPQAKGD